MKNKTKYIYQQLTELLHGVSNDASPKQKIITPRNKRFINIQRTYDAHKGLKWNERQELLWKEEISNK